jgi:hypothetical protein
LAHDGAAAEIGVRQVESGVEHRHSDALPCEPRGVGADSLKPPRELIGIAERGGQRFGVGDRFTGSSRQLLVEVIDPVTIAADVLHGAVGQGDPGRVGVILGFDRQDLTVGVGGGGRQRLYRIVVGDDDDAEVLEEGRKVAGEVRRRDRAIFEVGGSRHRLQPGKVAERLPNAGGLRSAGLLQDHDELAGRFHPCRVPAFPDRRQLGVGGHRFACWSPLPDGSRRYLSFLRHGNLLAWFLRL